MAKSAGWGWLGYHAWLAAASLDGFVPRPIFLRDGILFSDYAAGEPLSSVPEDARGLPAALSSYIARRVNALPLGEDPAFATPGYRWCGWDDLAATLGRIYGPSLAPLKKRAIRRSLARYVAPNPTLVVGRLRPADWVRAGGRLLKTDFEQHNFGGGESDIVDPAWDLASAIYEFRLPPDAERALLQPYALQAADPAVHARLPLYKILYAATALRAAQYWIARRPDSPRRHEWNAQFVYARSFAAFHLARYCGRTLGAAPAAWGSRLFFLDLDGVLDWGLLGFPHTTACGVEALRVLRRNGFAVVLHTARAVEHVREYCRAYRLPGGVAELGSVFYDAVRDWEIPLVHPEAEAQMARARAAIQALPGAVIDPEHRYSVRAYRFRDGRMCALTCAEVERALRAAGCGRLACVQAPADTYIVQKGAGKGPAIAAVQAHLGCAGEPVAAIGDSRQDLDMLRAAAIAFAPANASREVRDLAARGGCRVTRRPLQAGLLEAALELCPAAGDPLRDPEPCVEAPGSLIDELLRVPDRRPAARLLAALRWWEI